MPLQQLNAKRGFPEKRPTDIARPTMVISSAIYSLVTRMPYSDRIPDSVWGVLQTPSLKEQEAEENRLAEPVDPPPTPRQILHARLLDRRVQTQNASESGSATLAETESERAESMSDYNTNTVMQKYLEDQNCKFIELIDKNLDAVLQQQTQFEEDAFWKGFVFDLTRYAAKDKLVFKSKSLVGRAMNFGMSFVLSSGEAKKPSAEALQAEERQAHWQEMLDPLDHRSKVELLRQLYVDLGFPDQKNKLKLHDLAHPDVRPDSLLSQIELLAVLWIRLCFAGVRTFTPKAKSLYTKFKADELFLFNSKNFERALMAMIKAMELADEKFRALSQESRSETNERQSNPEGGSFNSGIEYVDGSDYTRPGKRALNAGERPSLFEVAQQFASEIS